VPHLQKEDVVIDGGNSYYIDDIRRQKGAAAPGRHYVDVGTSGGVWGLERGYCMMIGGDDDAVARLDRSSRRSRRARTSDRTPGREKAAAPPRTATSTAARRAEGTRQDGPQRHRVRIHGAYAEGLNILKHANVGKSDHAVDAETTPPLRHPEHYQYDFHLPDVAEVWRRGAGTRRGS
jgi:6-phosphogluconate dehydrogenase